MLSDPADSQKMDLEWASVWRAKCKEINTKTKKFGGQWCWASVWRAKSKEFNRKTKEFGGQWYWRILWARRKWI